jgi:DNA-binding CsgD family transcriptional regulator
MMQFDACTLRVLTVEVHRSDCLPGSAQAGKWSQAHRMRDQEKATRILDGLAAAGYRLARREEQPEPAEPARPGTNGRALHRTVRPTLPEHQLQTLQLIAAGAPDRQLARRMAVSVDAAKSRVKALLRVFGAQNRAHVVALAYRAGVLQPERIDMSWLPAADVPAADLVARRADRGLSQLRMAGLLGVSPEWLALRESGRRPFTVAVARQYAGLVGLDLGDDR